jgi:hypothetical protein
MEDFVSGAANRQLGGNSGELDEMLVTCDGLFLSDVVAGSSVCRHSDRAKDATSALELVVGS